MDGPLPPGGLRKVGRFSRARDDNQHPLLALLSPLKATLPAYTFSTCPSGWCQACPEIASFRAYTAALGCQVGGAKGGRDRSKEAPALTSPAARPIERLVRPAASGGRTRTDVSLALQASARPVCATPKATGPR